MTSTSVAPSARARRRPSSTPRYSATLLVWRPRTSMASSRTSPLGDVMTAAAAAGPGLPREPPTTWAVICHGYSYGNMRTDQARDHGLRRYRDLLPSLAA